MKGIFKALLIGCVLPLTAVAAPLQYEMDAREVVPGTWVLQGKTEDFTRRNGGNIVNTGFIITTDGVLVIDTGPSLKYGQAMRRFIESKTDQPIRYVFNTHHHPDHFLGNQAFADSRIVALKGTGEQIAAQGDGLAENMYRMIGDWMRSTEVELPQEQIEPGVLEVGGHRLRLLAFRGHTGADLVLLDETSGVLFASDMVFYQRALTTPHTPGLQVWLTELDQLSEIEFRYLVPGHGPVVQDQQAYRQMRDYLRWLDQILTESAEQGLSMTEVIRLPIPEEFASVALSRMEFIRTVAHLYAKYEEKAF
ncbi:quinoprotein relay system zinc metallohydrolase 1 [Neptuniibacter halophilus]|uniref:quinoprotein relay system zinc metallohydrolase 1 n=1 Tax=Neptuniibacter halophilus TaxID=651666 RepID=UPI0025742C0C|nr:quinoprotein relay system zinc metallohydrolase 1 [Neptuniibacter halophilus]